MHDAYHFGSTLACCGGVRSIQQSHTQETHCDLMRQRCICHTIQERHSPLQCIHVCHATTVYETNLDCFKKMRDTYQFQFWSGLLRSAVGVTLIQPAHGQESHCGLMRQSCICHSIQERCSSLQYVHGCHATTVYDTILDCFKKECMMNISLDFAHLSSLCFGPSSDKL